MIRRGDEADLTRAVEVASRLIRDTMKDVEAHARNVLTETLRSTPEGRQTAARVKRSRSYKAAVGKLRGLLDDLLREIGDFRGLIYEAEYQHWSRYLPPRTLRIAPGSLPPQRLIDRARAAMVRGLTVRQAIEPPISRARRTLAQALTVAGNRATSRADGNDQLGQWSRRSARAIEAITRVSLVDSQTMSHRLAGRDVIRPELLHPDLSLPEPV